MANNSIVAMIVASALLLACGEEEEKPKDVAKPASELTPADFDTGSFTTLDNDDVGDEMEDIDVHENDVQKKSSTANPLHFSLQQFLLDTHPMFPDCSSVEVLKDVITGAGPEVGFAVELDLGACMREQFFSSKMYESISESVAKVDAVFNFNCPGADYTQLNGQSTRAILGADKDIESIDMEAFGACNKDNATILRGMKMRMDLTLKGRFSESFAKLAGGRDFVLSTSASMVTLAQDGSPCRYDIVNGQLTVTDCVYLNRQEINKSVSGGEGNSAGGSGAKDPVFGLIADGDRKIIMVKAVQNGATGEVTGAYLQNGTVPVSVNQWNGSITLDGTTAPVWQLSDGAGTLSGKVGRSGVSTSPDAAPGTPVPPGTDPQPQDPPVDSDPPAQTTSYEIPELNISADSQVFFAGMYEGSGDTGGFQEHVTGNATVNISDTGKPVVLVLTSYESVLYTINVAEGVQVEAVIVSGYYRSGVKGLPDGVPLIVSSHEQGTVEGAAQPLKASFPYFYAYRDDTEQTYDLKYVDGSWQCVDEPRTWQTSDWLKAKEHIRKITGKDVTSAQGTGQGETFEVSAATAKSVLSAERQGGHCYKNPDGTLVQHGVPPNLP